MEINTSASRLETVFQRLLAREVFQSTATLCQLHNLVRICKRELSRQRGLQVGFKKLTMPAISEHVVHIDISEWLTTLGTFDAEPFSAVAGHRGKGIRAHAANLAGHSLPSR